MIGPIVLDVATAEPAALVAVTLSVTFLPIIAAVRWKVLPTAPGTSVPSNCHCLVKDVGELSQVPRLVIPRV